MNINESHYSAGLGDEEGEGSTGLGRSRPRAAMWVRLRRSSARWRIPHRTRTHTHRGIMHVILVHVMWVFAVPAVARVRRSSPGSRPSPAGDLRSALTPASVRRVDEAAGAGKMDGLVWCMVQTSLPVVVGR